MARTVDQIKALIYARVGLKNDFKKIFQNDSQAKYWGEIIHTVSVNIAQHEQIMDYHYTQVQAKNNEVVYNADWLIDRCLYFQYDAITPQVLTLNSDFEAVYATEDTTKRIITHVVLYFDATRVMHVKVAKNNPPVKLSAGELTAFQSYLTDGGNSTTLAVGAGFTGVALSAESVDPDYIWLEAQIRHTGDVTSTVQAAVILAIKNYYYTLDKDGYLRIISLVNAIQSITGVTDVLIKNLAIRSNVTAFGSKTYLVNTFAVVSEEEQAVAGYAYEEITAGEDLATDLTFIVG